MTRSQILDELWGYDYPIIDRTIDTYIKNLRKKLRLNCIVVKESAISMRWWNETIKNIA